MTAPARWLTAGPLERFTPEGITGVELDGVAVAIYRVGQQVFASPDACPHRNAPFTRLGHVEDGHVVCTWHGWRFRLSDGEHAAIPGACLKMLPTQVVDGVVQVDLAPLQPQGGPWGF